MTWAYFSKTFVISKTLTLSCWFLVSDISGLSVRVAALRKLICGNYMLPDVNQPSVCALAVLFLPRSYRCAFLRRLSADRPVACRLFSSRSPGSTKTSTRSLLSWASRRPIDSNARSRWRRWRRSTTHVDCRA